WSQWKNLFCVTMKQKSRIRGGSRQKSTHEKTSKGPAQRLLDSNSLEEKAKEKLEDDLKRLNPLVGLKCRRGRRCSQGDSCFFGFSLKIGRFSWFWRK
ncbi:MAG: hypothetical protein LR011_07475, partial [Verrucomicrobia bacterium]|nr:hypothetical protein [Verrucomicrobiota bacterium]